MSVLLAEWLVEKVFDIKLVYDSIVLIKLTTGDSFLLVFSVYIPQTSLEESTKDTFYDNLQAELSKHGENEIGISCGDCRMGSWNFSFSFSDGNVDEERILGYTVVNDLVIGNTFFAKRDSHLVTYGSGFVSPKETVYS